MPIFKSPIPPHQINVALEKAAITNHFTKRNVPRSQPGRLLLATWNIANLGAQGRTPQALELIAHIMKRFDLIAVQEVNERFKFFLEIVNNMGPAFDYIMSDTAGNSERLAFIYRKQKVSLRNLFGEIALRMKEFPKRTVVVRYRDKGQEKQAIYSDVRFIPFDRNPFIGSFKAGTLDFTLVNVHLYFGKFQNSKKPEDHAKYCRRVLEIFALSRWASKRKDSDKTFDTDIILLGDMNVPAMEPEESTYKALIKFGMQPINYRTRTGGSNIRNNRTYDQVTFAPGTIEDKVLKCDVFDFDNAIFASLWKKIEAKYSSERKRNSEFNKHVQHHISDHRPVWIELNIS